VVLKKWVCAGRVSAQSFGTRIANSADLWISLSAVGGEETHFAVHADVVGLGCGGGGARGRKNEVLRGGIKS